MPPLTRIERPPARDDLMAPRPDRRRASVPVRYPADTGRALTLQRSVGNAAVARAADDETFAAPRRGDIAEAGDVSDGAARGSSTSPAAGTLDAAASPVQSPGLGEFAANVGGVAASQQEHEPTSKKVADAQAAVEIPPKALRGEAARKDVETLFREPRSDPFNGQAFKAAVRRKLADFQPKSLEEAQEYSQSQSLAEASGDLEQRVEAGKARAVGEMPARVQRPLDPSKATARAATELTPEAPGSRPADVDTAAAVPEPRREEDVSLAADAARLDDRIGEVGVTETQLAGANEPAFTAALQRKRGAEAFAREAPKGYRQLESGVLAEADEAIGSEASQAVSAMFGGRSVAFSGVTARQRQAQRDEEQERDRIGRDIEAIYNKTKADVGKRLEKMDTDVKSTFARKSRIAFVAFEVDVTKRILAYKDERYGDLGGIGLSVGRALWVADQVFGEPDEINRFFDTSRRVFFDKMEDALDEVVKVVDTGLADCRRLIADGKSGIKNYVRSLPEWIRSEGVKAAQEIAAKFQELEAQVDRKKNELVDTVATMYHESVEKMESKVAEMKAASRGLLSSAFDALEGVIQTILQLKDLLLGVLYRAAGVIDLIITDPIGFLGNLVRGVKAGFDRFISNILHHLKEGLLGWLFGAMAAAGVQMPEKFNLAGVFSLVLQVLGLTYANFRSRAVKIVGETVVSRLEQAAEIFKIFVTRGAVGLWEFIKEKVTDLVGTVIEGIKSFVITRIVTAGITWIIGLLNPASAFIKACKAIYDVVQFFIERGRQILDMVNAVLDSLEAIAKGAVGGVATKVENALARTVPVVISFLAALLGLGGISGKIREIIAKIQAPVNRVIDWLIHKAVSMVERVGGLFGGKKKDGRPDGEEEIAVPVPMHNATHTLHVRLGKKPEVTMESEEKKIELKITKAVAKLTKPGTTNQSPARISKLKKIDDLVDVLKKSVADGKDLATVQANTDAVVKEIMSYGNRFKESDIEAVLSGVYPGPVVGRHEELTKSDEEPPPDGRSRHSHHAPQKELAKTMASELESAGEVVNKDVATSGDSLIAAGVALDSWVGTEGNKLSAILVHENTHTVKKEVPKRFRNRIHGSELVNEVAGKLKGDPHRWVTTTTTSEKYPSGRPSSKPVGKTFVRHFWRVTSMHGSDPDLTKRLVREEPGDADKLELSKKLRAKAKKIVLDVYSGASIQAFRQVDEALDRSVVDGTKTKRDGAKKKLPKVADKIWKTQLRKLFS